MKLKVLLSLCVLHSVGHVHAAPRKRSAGSIRMTLMGTPEQRQLRIALDGLKGSAAEELVNLWRQSGRAGRVKTSTVGDLWNEEKLSLYSQFNPTGFGVRIFADVMACNMDLVDMNIPEANKRGAHPTMDLWFTGPQAELIFSTMESANWAVIESGLTHTRRGEWIECERHQPAVGVATYKCRIANHRLRESAPAKL